MTSEQEYKTPSNKGFIVVETASKGRVVQATRSFSPGDTVLVDFPLLSVPTLVSLPGTISGFRTIACFACCQLHDQETCEEFQTKFLDFSKILENVIKKGQEFALPLVKFLGTLFLQQEANKDFKKLEECPIWIKSMNLFEDPLKFSEKEIQERKTFISQLCQMVHEKYCRVAEKDMLTFLLKWGTNAVDNTESHVMSIYETADMFEHACLRPNASYFIQDLKFVCKAADPIETGDFISISYISGYPNFFYRSFGVRQAILSRKYHFSCQCWNCQLDKSDVCRSFVCTHCEGVVQTFNDESIPWNCTECCQEVSKEAKQNYCEEEQRFAKIKTGLLSVNDILNNKLLHNSHHLVIHHLRKLFAESPRKITLEAAKVTLEHLKDTIGPHCQTGKAYEDVGDECCKHAAGYVSEGKRHYEAGLRIYQACRGMNHSRTNELLTKKQNC